MEFQVRDARLTDIDRVTGLIERADSRWRSADLATAADLLRQFVYMPSAAVLVAVEGRQVLGAAVLAIRPSVAAGGLVGSVDLLVVEPGHELADVGEALLREVTRTARNKGCVLLEGEIPTEPAEHDRWEKLGFRESGRRLVLPLARVPVPPR
ncbi:MAG: GNAT family N-acetyltransferase [Chloroflexota bacterium]|nr:GNAT family N-acetyltransferase [Chloroflexota bacterium]